MQDVALLLLQVRVATPPEFTVLGLAPMVTVGAELTGVDDDAEPPAPEVCADDGLALPDVGDPLGVVVTGVQAASEAMTAEARAQCNISGAIPTIDPAWRPPEIIQHPLIGIRCPHTLAQNCVARGSNASMCS
jgi:hypothetical protein